MPQTSDICILLVRELEGFRREVARFPDDEELWKTVPGVTNSAGNLALHVAGNLQHFVGACLGNSGFVRDRQAEFSARSGSRASVDARLAAAIHSVTTTLTSMPDDQLSEPMRAAPNGMTTRTGLFLLHLVSHTGFHLGQAGYLRRTLAGESAVSAGPLPLGVLAERDSLQG